MLMSPGLRRSVAALVITAGLATSALADATIGLIELDGKIKDRQPAKGAFAGFGGGKHAALHMSQLLKAFDDAAADAKLKGIVIRIRDAEISRSNIDELGRAMERFRKAGKKIHIFAENYGPSEIMLGCKADEVVIQAGGGVMLPGVYMEEMFLGDMFRWVGIQPDFVQIGDYKGASETMANAKPSKAWDENINGLLDSMYADMRGRLQNGRKLDDAGVDKALEAAWMASDTDAKKVGLVDTIIDLPELENHLAKSYGTSIVWDDEIVASGSDDMAKAMANPFMMFTKLMEKPSYEPKRDTIAVLHIDGAIVDGESESGGFMGGERSVGSRTLRRALDDIETNDKIKGLIVRIDSPGGSAIASEMIWQGIHRVAKGSGVGESKIAPKPVFVSVGGMAASGGYYCLVAGDKVYVNPSSIVGSIGVVGGKMALGGVMEKLHINTVGRARGPRAGMFSMSAPWTEQERALVRTKMTETYDLFTSRVSQGRSGIDLSKTAEGRLFTGKRAVELKMADAVGSLEDATTDLAAKLNLQQGKFDVMDYPAPRSLAEVLEDTFGRFAGSDASAPRITGPGLGAISALSIIENTAVEVLGARHAANISSSLRAVMQLRKEPVILASPRVLLWNW